MEDARGSFYYESVECAKISRGTPGAPRPLQEKLNDCEVFAVNPHFQLLSVKVLTVRCEVSGPSGLMGKDWHTLILDTSPSDSRKCYTISIFHIFTSGNLKFKQLNQKNATNIINV